MRLEATPKTGNSMYTTPGSAGTPTTRLRCIVHLGRVPRLWLSSAVVAVAVAAGCAGPGASSDASHGAPAASELSDTADSAQPAAGAGTESYSVVRATGYVSGLMRDAGRGEEHSYEQSLGATDMAASVDLIAAGYLVDIVPGVVWADTRDRRRLTPAEIESWLRSLDEDEQHLKDLGMLGPDEVASLERERKAALENALPEPDDVAHLAYRILVTEVLSGDFTVGELLDVQVPLSIFTTLQQQKDVLKGTPRAVVGGGWSTHIWSNYQLQGPDRAPLDTAVFYPWIEMFWLDESLWHPDDLKPNPGDSPDNGLGDEPPTLTTPPGGGLTERSVGGPEALYLRGLHDLHPDWGDLQTLDDLADAIRTATTTTTPPTTTVPTTTAQPATTVPREADDRDPLSGGS